MLPAASHPTSVGRLNEYGLFAPLYMPCPDMAASSSTASGRRPIVITTRPWGLNLITMFAPSSTAQMLARIYTGSALKSRQMRQIGRGHRPRRAWRPCKRVADPRNHQDGRERDGAGDDPIGA